MATVTDPAGDGVARIKELTGGLGPHSVIEAVGGCRIDEIRRLELDCLIWDEGAGEQTGQTYPVCLLRVPQNKTSGPFSKPVDPSRGS